MQRRLMRLASVGVAIMGLGIVTAACTPGPCNSGRGFISRFPSEAGIEVHWSCYTWLPTLSARGTEISGTVYNVGSRHYRYLELWASISDEKGVADKVWTNFRELGPGERRPFKMVSPDISPWSVRDVSFEIRW